MIGRLSDSHSGTDGPHVMAEAVGYDDRMAVGLGHDAAVFCSTSSHVRAAAGFAEGSFDDSQLLEADDSLNFFRGVLIGLPVSALLWGALFAIYWSTS